MKGVRGRGSRKVSKLAPKDVISTMPEEVITNILHCLPLQDAVQTSILSKDWKFKWTMMTQLVFDANFHEYLEVTKNENEYVWIISRLLLSLKGSITKFALYISPENGVDVKHIDNWIIYLSKKGIKEFTFQDWDGEQPELTTHLFSCLELTYLELNNCELRPTSEFGGFPNLLSLDVMNVIFKSWECGEYLTWSPLLENLKLKYNTSKKLKQVEIAKLENLKVLSIELCKIEDMAETTISSIFQLAGSLPKLQELNAENRVSTSLSCLKTLFLDDIDFRSDTMISCAIELIRSSSNLETLTIHGLYEDRVPLPAVCSSQADFSIMGQLQLLKVKLVRMRGIENEFCLVKYLLDCSPLLKKMDIHAYSSEVCKLGGANGERELATNLLKLRRASPLAELNIVWINIVWT
ncbi:F-box/FBD/LRR-repeat protein-like protein [Tanacetum coccineum]